MSQMPPETAAVSLADYAELMGKSLRTVQRWLADDLLPAYQDVDGRWWVPADARPDKVRRRTTSPGVVRQTLSRNRLIAAW